MVMIHLPDMLSIIEDEAFENVDFEAVAVPAYCTSIGRHAFKNCRKLKYIMVPAGIQIEADAFEGCEDVVVDRIVE